MRRNGESEGGSPILRESGRGGREDFARRERTGGREKVRRGCRPPPCPRRTGRSRPSRGRPSSRRRGSAVGERAVGVVAAAALRRRRRASAAWRARARARRARRRRGAARGRSAPHATWRASPRPRARPAPRRASATRAPCRARRRRRPARHGIACVGREIAGGSTATRAPKVPVHAARTASGGACGGHAVGAEHGHEADSVAIVGERPRAV